MIPALLRGLPLLVLLSACVVGDRKDEDDDDGAGDGGETGAPEGDSGADSGAGGGDSGDAGEDLPACEGALVWDLEARNGAGEVCEPCAGSEDVVLAARIINPCEESFSVVVEAGSVVSSLSMVNSATGEGMGMSGGSTGEVMELTIASGEIHEELVAVGRLSGGTWEAEVGFSDRDRHRASTLFEVLGGGGGGGGGGTGGEDEPPDEPSTGP
jgi:hypothetical protein